MNAPACPFTGASTVRVGEHYECAVCDCGGTTGEEMAMSASVGVTCGACGAEIGDQFRPGDAVGLLSAHINACPYSGVRPGTCSTGEEQR